MKHPEVSVIIPAYNEEQGLLECVNKVKEVMKNVSHEIIVVNDGSKDRTEEVASKIKNIKLVSYNPNRGKGYALRAGMKAASGNILVVQDADMATKEIIDVIKPIMDNEADFVNGTRMILPMEKGAMKKLHVIGN